MKLIYLVGLLVVLVIVDSEDEEIKKPENESIKELENEPIKESENKPIEEPDNGSIDESYEDSDEQYEASDDVQFDNQTETDSEYGDKFEGDMILPIQTYNRIKDRDYRWPKISGHVQVPYVIDSVFSNRDKKTIEKAMNELHSKTCIKFNPRKKERHYVHIVSKKGCWSYVGKKSGKQELSLSRNGCVRHGIVVHELIHALGFGHQHSHYKRDEKVTIYWNNIKTGEKHNFDILDKRRYDNFGTEYDINSIMHYDDKAFSKNGKRTIQAKNQSDQRRMGQREGLSGGDITRIKNMYKC